MNLCTCAKCDQCERCIPDDHGHWADDGNFLCESCYKALGHVVRASDVLPDQWSKDAQAHLERATGSLSPVLLGLMRNLLQAVIGLGRRVKALEDK